MRNQDAPALPLTGDAYTDFSQYDGTNKTSYNPECQGFTKREVVLKDFMVALIARGEALENVRELAKDLTNDYFKELEK